MSTITTRVGIDRATLQRLVSSLESYWNDNRLARTPENVFWREDRVAIEHAKAILRDTRSG